MNQKKLYNANKLIKQNGACHGVLCDDCPNYINLEYDTNWPCDPSTVMASAEEYIEEAKLQDKIKGFLEEDK
jgi:hypothetical protein